MDEARLQQLRETVTQAHVSRAAFAVNNNLAARVWAENYARDVSALLEEVGQLKSEE